MSIDLGAYLADPSRTPRKVAVEWELVRAMPAAPPMPPGEVRWPEAVLQRPSGRVLALSWALASRARPPSGLEPLPAAPPGVRSALARCWAAAPGGPGTADRSFRGRLASWLTEEADAIGDVMVARAAEGDLDEARALGEAWLSRGVAGVGGPRQVRQAAQVGALVELARVACAQGVGRWLRDPEALEMMAQVAFSLGDDLVCLRCCAILEQRSPGPPAVDDPRRCAILALSIAATARSGDDATAVKRFAQEWPAAPFPLPEHLAYALLLHASGPTLEKLWRHVGAEGPTWLRLARAHALGERPPERLLEEIVPLLQRPTVDERELFVATRVALSLSLAAREPWLARLGLVSIWRELATLEHPRIKVVAGASLVLLSASDQERLTHFDGYLSRLAVDNNLAREAAQVWLRAVVGLGAWDRLDAWIRWARGSRSADAGDLNDEALLVGIVPFTERQLALLLRQVERLPGRLADVTPWCAAWERLLALPLNASSLQVVLSAFTRIEVEGRRTGCPAMSAPLFADVRLQLLRRAKAEVERLLARAEMPEQERQETRARLRQVDLGATLDILRHVARRTTTEE